MAEPQRGLPPRLAVAFGSVGFFALLIVGFGMLSLLTDADVLAVGGLGQLPGILGTLFAVAAFVAAVWAVVRRPHPSYGGTVLAVVGAFLGYLLGIVVGGAVSGTDVARVAAAVGGFATSWFAVVLASAALVAAWAAVALARTRAGRPRWPWERD